MSRSIRWLSFSMNVSSSFPPSLSLAAMDDLARAPALMGRWPVHALGLPSGGENLSSRPWVTALA